MDIRIPATLAVVTAALAGCDQPPMEAKQSMAEYVCLVRSIVVQGYGRVGPDGELQDTEKTPKGTESLAEASNAVPSQSPKPHFRFTSGGHFVIDYGQVTNYAPIPAYDLKCTGDFNAGILTSIQVDGTIHRPKAGEAWSIETLK